MKKKVALFLILVLGVIMLCSGCINSEKTSKPEYGEIKDQEVLGRWVQYMTDSIWRFDAEGYLEFGSYKLKCYTGENSGGKKTMTIYFPDFATNTYKAQNYEYSFGSNSSGQKCLFLFGRESATNGYTTDVPMDVILIQQ